MHCYIYRQKIKAQHLYELANLELGIVLFFNPLVFDVVHLLIIYCRPDVLTVILFLSNLKRIFNVVAASHLKWLCVQSAESVEYIDFISTEEWYPQRVFWVTQNHLMANIQAWSFIE